MAMNKTRYSRKAVLDHFLGQSAHTFPTNRYLALFSADPTDLGTLTNELAQTGYTRPEISDFLGAADSVTGVITNALDITFGTAGADWAEFTHMGVMDVATLGTGNMIYFGPATTSRVVTSGDTLVIKAGQLSILEQ